MLAGFVSIFDATLPMLGLILDLNYRRLPVLSFLPLHRSTPFLWAAIWRRRRGTKSSARPDRLCLASGSLWGWSKALRSRQHPGSCCEEPPCHWMPASAEFRKSASCPRLPGFCSVNRQHKCYNYTSTQTFIHETTFIFLLWNPALNPEFVEWEWSTTNCLISTDQGINP